MPEPVDYDVAELVDTPTVMVDKQRLMSNIQSFHDTVTGHGSKIRSHVKTHKCVEIAKMQIEMGACGIAAAKVSEAEVFVEAGIDDVVIAYPVFGAAKWTRISRLAERCRLAVHVENETAVAGLSRCAQDAGVVIYARVEVDSGFHRTGGTPEESVELAERVAGASGLHFEGFTSHRSAFFEDGIGRPVSDLGREEGEFMLEVAELARGRGIEVEQIVAGSTPTGRSLAEVDGITEVVAGTYPFCDAGMGDLGVAAYDDVAVSILTTVVVRRSNNGYTVDGGGKTFSWSAYPGADPRHHGRRVGSNDYLASLTEEHGIVASPDGEAPKLGDRIPFYPAHVCPAVNLTDSLVVIDQGNVSDRWSVAARGKVK